VSPSVLCFSALASHQFRMGPSSSFDSGFSRLVSPRVCLFTTEGAPFGEDLLQHLAWPDCHSASARSQGHHAASYFPVWLRCLAGKCRVRALLHSRGSRGRWSARWDTLLAGRYRWKARGENKDG